MSQLFQKFGWRVAGGLDTQEGQVTICLLAMPFLRDALLANDVIITTWASYTKYQLTDSLLRSTVASLKSQARGIIHRIHHFVSGVYISSVLVLVYLHICCVILEYVY